MKLKSRLLRIMLAVVLALTFCLPLFGCDNGDSGTGGGEGGTGSSKDPYVTAVQVLTQPTKTSYLAGETFDPKGLTFNATWMIDGKETVTKLTYGTCDGWTHKNEPLTADITGIEFTIGGFKFTIAITVTAVENAEITVEHSFKENYFMDDEIDLTTIVVKVKSGNEQQPTTEYDLYDNGVKLEKDASKLAHYKPTEKGKHTFKVEFGEAEATFEVTFWDENDLDVTEFSVDGKGGFKSSYSVGEHVDLTVIHVNVTLSNDDASLTLTKEVTDFTVKDNGTLIPKEQWTDYELTNGTHTFTVEYRGQSDTFELVAKAYDTIKVECALGDDDITLLQDDGIDRFEFFHYFRVYMTMSADPQEKMIIYPHEYTITYTKNSGSAVTGEGYTAGSDNEKSLQQSLIRNTGTYHVTFHYNNLQSDPVTFTVKAHNTKAKDSVSNSANGATTAYNNGEVIRPGGRSYYGITLSPNRLEDFPTAEPRSWFDMRGAGTDRYSRTSAANYFGDQLAYISNFGGVKNKSELRVHIYSDAARTARITVEMSSHDVVMSTSGETNPDAPPEKPTDVTSQATEMRDIIVKDHFLSTLFKAGVDDPVHNFLDLTSGGFTEKPIPNVENLTIYGYASRVTSPANDKNLNNKDEQGRYYDSPINTSFTIINLGEFDLAEGYNTIVIRMNPEALVTVSIGSINVLYLS